MGGVPHCIYFFEQSPSIQILPMRCPEPKNEAPSFEKQTPSKKRQQVKDQQSLISFCVVYLTYQLSPLRSSGWTTSHWKLLVLGIKSSKNGLKKVVGAWGVSPIAFISLNSPHQYRSSP